MKPIVTEKHEFESRGQSIFSAFLGFSDCQVSNTKDITKDFLMEYLRRLDYFHTSGRFSVKTCMKELKLVVLDKSELQL